MKTPDLERFRKILKNNELKATPQRLAVHRAMMELVHASADMVRDHILETTETKISIASVYNILTQMADMGVYSHRMSENNKMYFDLKTARHAHLYDTKYDEIRDIDDEELIQLVEEHFRGRRFRGYKIDGFDVQVICHSTKTRRKTTLKK